MDFLNEVWAWIRCLTVAEWLGVLGFGLSILTFIITRFERKKRLTIDLYCQAIEDFEFEDDQREERLVIIDIINNGGKIVPLDIASLKIYTNKTQIQYGLDWLGKENFRNPLNPGQNHKFAVYLDALVDIAKIHERHQGRYPIVAEIRDIEGKKYTTSRKFNLVLEVDEILK